MNNIQLIIKKKAYLKLKYFVHNTSGEISGMGKTSIKKNKDDDFFVYLEDIVIFHQACSGSSTSISEDAIGKFTYELQKNKENTEEWNVWWHSHGHLGVFWSTTDTNTIEEHKGGSFLISLVTNKDLDFKARLDIFPEDKSPFKKQSVCEFEIDDIQIEVDKDTCQHKKHLEKEKLKIEKELTKTGIVNDDKKLENFCIAEIKEKVEQTRFFVNQRSIFLPSKNKNASKKKWRYWNDEYWINPSYSLFEDKLHAR